MNFTELIDLANERVGGRALACNDDFFAPMSNMLKHAAPVFIADKYTTRGKWMDGWESRRNRNPSFDWCVVKLGLRGVIRGVDVHTAFFTGNYPEHCAIEACDVPGAANVKKLLADATLWTEILPKTALKGDSHNEIAVRSLRPWTHLRLKIYPDGGVARLRVYGDVVPDWERVAKGGKLVDLAAVENGGRVLENSDKHYGHPNNMLMPGRAPNMGDGWETKRRRGPGHDWAIIKLGASGVLEKLEVDTNHFKGNFPDRFSLEGCLAPDLEAPQLMSGGTVWSELIPQTKLKAHTRHYFTVPKEARQTVSHVRINIYPDGGVSRLRLYGRVAKA